MNAMKKFFHAKKEKGQVLVFLALILVGLVAIMGLAIDVGYMYSAYAELRRSVDAAALSATTQFKKDYSHDATKIMKATKEFLYLNDVHPSRILIESCAFIDEVEFDEQGLVLNETVTDYTETNPVNATGTGGSGDPTLCTAPPRKLVRVTAQEYVPTFFLRVVPFFPTSFPISATSTSEAASLELVLVIDSSESMAWYPEGSTTPWPSPSDNRDPSQCSPDDCHPFKEIKEIARDFIDTYLYPPYDRVAIVTFNKNASLYDPNTGRGVADPNQAALTSNIELLKDTLVGGNSIGQNAPGLQVYGVGADPDSGSVNAPFDNVHACGAPGLGYGGPDFPDGFGLYDETGATDDVYDLETNTFDPDQLSEAPCRLYQTVNGGVFSQLYAPEAGFLPSNKTYMGTSNIGEGLSTAAHVFGNPNENLRQEALWVTILLTDGVANIAFDKDDDGNPTIPICPISETTGAEHGATGKLDPVCRDTDPLVRHCKSANVGSDPAEANYYHCMDQVGPPFAFEQWPSTWTWGNTTNVIDSDLYDADDYARDMADLLSDSAHSLIFAISLSANPSDPTTISDYQIYYEPGGPRGSDALMTYIAAKGGTENYYSSSAATLPDVFLSIASKISTRLTK
jgi:hypothetical protein